MGIFNLTGISSAKGSTRCELVFSLSLGSYRNP